MLFGVSSDNIGFHISNILNEKELDLSATEESSIAQKEGNKNTSVEKIDGSVNYRPAKLYNLDVILAVGYRVKSQRGILFRRWANKVFKRLSDLIRLSRCFIY